MKFYYLYREEKADFELMSHAAVNKIPNSSQCFVELKLLVTIVQKRTLNTDKFYNISFSDTLFKYTEISIN